MIKSVKEEEKLRNKFKGSKISLHVQTLFIKTWRYAVHSEQSRPVDPALHLHCPVSVSHSSFKLPAGLHSHGVHFPAGR